jgi:exopolyphosphatase/guanosine-5'-triphosphate,3'-diphosphate pyrophosphatase
MDEFNCRKHIAVATNAFRAAGNGREIAEEIRVKFNLNIKIVSGEEEARLSYLGAVSGFKEKRKNAVIDIGGGSTELIFGEGNEIEFKKSFPAGVVSLTEKYFKNDPPLVKEAEKLKSGLDYIFSAINKRFNPETAIAIAGTPTTLACIQKGLPEFDEEAIEGSLLHRNELENLIYELQSLKKNEILSKYKSVVEGREDVLLTGTIILNKIMAALNLDKVMVSTKGIRYGAVLEYLIRD